MKMRQILLLLLITTITNAFAQEDTNSNQANGDSLMIFTLEEAQEYALAHNQSMQNAIIDIEIAKKKIWETTAIGLPQVNASAEYNYFTEIPTQLMPDFLTPAVVGVNMQYFGLTPVQEPEEGQMFPVQFGAEQTANYGISVSQIIFNGSYIVGLQTSKIFKKVSEQTVKKTEKDIREQVANSYYLVLVTKESTEVLDATLENMENTLKELQAMYEQGFVSETDVDQIRLTKMTIENSKNSLKRQNEIVKNLLKFQMGVPLEQNIELTNNFSTLVDQVDYLTLKDQDFNLQENIDYQLLNTQLLLQEMNLKNQKAAYLPSLVAFYSYSKNAQRNEFNFFDSDEEWYPTSVLGLQLQVPIFSSGQRNAKVKQAKLSVEKMQNMKKQAEQGLYLEVAQAKTELMNAFEKYKNEEENRALSKKIYEKTLIKFKEGMASSMDITQANNQYLEAQSNYIKASSELLSSKNKLDKLLNNH